mmetsp:Transcript_35237/g.45438  ORF Transcript_35237/g.45438 Transcript_35237/m.45438 type:complete len:214 (-) Transcript_35237:128-769(-)
MWQFDPKNKVKTVDENKSYNGFQKEAHAFARWHNNVSNNNGDVNMGSLLTKFFNFYGREFDIKRIGVSITRNPPGPFELPKDEKEKFHPVHHSKTTNSHSGNSNNSNKNNQKNNDGNNESITTVIASTSPYIEDPIAYPSRNVAQSAFRFEQSIQYLFSNKIKDLEIEGIGLLNRNNSPNSPSVVSKKTNEERKGGQSTKNGINILKGIVFKY